MTSQGSTLGLGERVGDVRELLGCDIAFLAIRR
jgi:hypothetical protein